MTESRRLRGADRLRTRREYLSIQSQGKPVHGRRFLLLHQPNPDFSASRLGLIVTKKTGNAVVRNRWKRLIREVYRLHPLRGRLRGDHVVIVRASQKGSPDREAFKELNDMFARAKKLSRSE